MRILIYGDSNSWGYLDDGRGIPFDDRWPVVMARILRQNNAAKRPVTLIEECLPGRTTNCPDPVEGPHFDGALPLLPILLSQQPLDHVIFMLGTNDMKARFGRGPDEITAGIMELVKIAQQSRAGIGGWNGDASPAVTVICPPMLGDRADDPSWVRFDEWLGGMETSQLLPAVLGRACSERRIPFINANEVAQSSHRDPIHWASETHLAFGQFMATKMAEIMSAI